MGEDEALEEGSTPIGVLNPGAGGPPRTLPVRARGPVHTGGQPLRRQLPAAAEGSCHNRFLLTCKKTISWVPAGSSKGSLPFRAGLDLFGGSQRGHFSAGCCVEAVVSSVL